MQDTRFRMQDKKLGFNTASVHETRQ